MPKVYHTTQKKSIAFLEKNREKRRKFENALDKIKPIVYTYVIQQLCR